MIEFTVYKDTLSVDPDSLTNPDIRYLWELDKSKKKDKALKAILYVFFKEDLSNENPLSQIPYYERESDCRLRAFGDPDFEFYSLGDEDWTEAIEMACSSYRLEVADTLKDIYTLDKKMDQLGKMLLKTKPKIIRNEHDTSGKVTYTTNIKIINDALNDIVSIISAKASLVSMHVHGVIPKELRGGLSPLSRGKIKTKS